ncbi:MAG: glucose 1-dehydrogenase [Candidatus Puniceispirillaceae bacterium]
MAENLFDVRGKTALVTGASRGIGFALARGLGMAGARIILNGRNQTALDRAVAELQKDGIEAQSCAFDVSDHDESKKAIDGLEASGRAIDILVNNAGMQHRAPLEDFEIEKFDQLLATNLRSVFIVSQAAAQYMLARRAGKIINIASVMSLLARPSVAPYTASKGAVSSLTKGMAADWAAKGLNCNAIAPGYFRTELNEALTANPEFNEWLIARTPAGRWGETHELVGVCLFLASSASDFVNGQTIFVDGGMTATV